MNISNFDYFTRRNQILILRYRSFISGTPLFKMNPAHTKGEGEIPLSKHPIYGETCIRFQERYNPNGLKHFHYGWELLDEKPGINIRHISAWGSESHSSNPAVQTETEPFHHHHDPDRHPPRIACYTIHSLDSVMHFVCENYIKTGAIYTPIQT